MGLELAGVILGIGGVAVSMMSKRSVIIGRLEGRISTVRLFVVRAPITLSGRDKMSLEDFSPD